jgi:hypothetical protein
MPYNEVSYLMGAAPDEGPVRVPRRPWRGCLKQIPIMAETIGKRQLLVVGAYYDLDTGVVQLSHV